jgi:hypothetical protein
MQQLKFCRGGKDLDWNEQMLPCVCHLMWSWRNKGHTALKLLAEEFDVVLILVGGVLSSSCFGTDKPTLLEADSFTSLLRGGGLSRCFRRAIRNF